MKKNIQKLNISNFTAKRGFVAFSTVIIVSFVVLSIALATTMVSISEARSTFAIHNSEVDLGLTESCIEDTFLKIEVDNAGLSYAGGTIVEPQGSCTNTIVSKVGNTWTMQTETVSTAYKKKIQTIFNRMPVALITLSDTEDSSVGSLVNGCVTTALSSSQSNKSYVGGDITNGSGTCTVAVSKSGRVWTVLVVGTATDTSYAGARQVIFDRQPPYISLTSWKAI